MIKACSPCAEGFIISGSTLAPKLNGVWRKQPVLENGFPVYMKPGFENDGAFKKKQFGPSFQWTFSDAVKPEDAVTVMLRQEFAQECPYDTMYSNLLKRQIGLSLMFWPAELKGVYDDWLRVPFIKAIDNPYPELQAPAPTFTTCSSSFRIEGQVDAHVWIHGDYYLQNEKFNGDIYYHNDDSGEHSDSIFVVRGDDGKWLFLFNELNLNLVPIMKTPAYSCPYDASKTSEFYMVPHGTNLETHGSLATMDQNLSIKAISSPGNCRVNTYEELKLSLKLRINELAPLEQPEPIASQSTAILYDSIDEIFGEWGKVCVSRSKWNPLTIPQYILGDDCVFDMFDIRSSCDKLAQFIDWYYNACLPNKATRAKAQLMAKCDQIKQVTFETLQQEMNQ